jgi:hypothetical protein
MYCQICSEWALAKSRKRDENGNTTRFCSTIKNFVPLNQLSCNKFNLADRFWCSKLQHFVDTKVCINSIQNKNKEECNGCRIGLFNLRRKRLNGHTTLIKIKRKEN